MEEERRQKLSLPPLDPPDPAPKEGVQEESLRNQIQADPEEE
jgi:hypothetical protein